MVDQRTAGKRLPFVSIKYVSNVTSLLFSAPVRGGPLSGNAVGPTLLAAKRRMAADQRKAA